MYEIDKKSKLHYKVEKDENISYFVKKSYTLDSISSIQNSAVTCSKLSFRNEYIRYYMKVHKCSECTLMNIPWSTLCSDILKVLLESIRTLLG